MATTVQTPRPFRSLTVTLTRMFLLSGLFTLLISTVLGLYFSFQAQKRVVVEQQQLLARGAANAVEVFIEEKWRILDQAVDVNGLVSTPDKQTFLMSKLIGREHSFRQLILLDSKGKEIKKVSNFSLAEADHLSAFKGEIIKAALQNKRYISSVYINESTSEPMVMIAVPATNSFHEPEGAFIAEINLKFMWDLVSQIRVGQKGLAYVVNKDGTLLAFTDTSRVLQHEDVSLLNEPAQFKKGIADPGADVSRGILGTYVVSGFVPLDTPDWAVVVELPVLEAYASVFTIFLYSLLVLLLGILFAIGSGRFFSKKITKGIIDLNDAAEKISEGNLDTTIQSLPDEKTENEISQLSASFNAMTARLKESYKTLEDKVVERTKELDSKVEELGRINKLMVDRELKMVELKKEIKDLQAHQK